MFWIDSHGCKSKVLKWECSNFLKIFRLFSVVHNQIDLGNHQNYIVPFALRSFYTIKISISLGNFFQPWPTFSFLCCATMKTKKNDFSSHQMLILCSKKWRESLVSSNLEKLMKNLSTSQPSGFSYFVPRKTLTMINWKSFSKNIFSLGKKRERGAHNYEASLSCPKKIRELERKTFS